MATTLFVMPLKKGKKGDYMNFLSECMGAKKSEYEDLLKRYALNNVKIWLHTINGKDYAMFTHDMDDDAARRLQNWSSSTHPFDQWFDKHIQDCYEVADQANVMQPQFFGELDTRKK